MSTAAKLASRSNVVLKFSSTDIPYLLRLPNLPHLRSALEMVLKGSNVAVDPAQVKPFLDESNWADDKVSHPYTISESAYQKNHVPIQRWERQLGCKVWDANVNPSLSRLFKFRHPAFNVDVCKWIIAEAEQFAAAHNGWTTHRHSAYPTTDIPVGSMKVNLSAFKHTHARTLGAIRLGGRTHRVFSRAPKKEGGKGIVLHPVRQPNEIPRAW